MQKRKLFRIADIFICAAVLLSAVLFIIAGAKGSGEGAVAQIRINSEIQMEIDLTEVSQPYDIDVEGELNAVIHIEKGAVYFKESECEDKICIHTGRLTQAGDSAVCLPARISVTVTGGGTVLDEVAG